MDLLALAFYLSVLTYYLGVLIRALPIPLYGVKRWAPQLMIDGLFSAILVFSYRVILWLIEYMSSILGASWPNYQLWLLSEVNIIVGMIATLQLLGAALSSAGLNFLANALISPLISSLTYLLTFLVTVSALAGIIAMFSNTLIALGLVLHAIPFRLARASGATLIALVVVFTIGIPLMPQFVESITSSFSTPSQIGYGYALAEIRGFDSTGSPTPFYLYEIYSENETLLARYVADEHGVVNTVSPYKGIPSAKHIAYVKYAGYEYRLEIDPRAYETRSDVYSSIITINITLPNIVVLRTLRYVSLFNVYSYIITYRNSTMASLNVSALSGGYIVVVCLASDTVSVYVDNSTAPLLWMYEYSWGGVRLVARSYELPYGEHSIDVFIDGVESPKPVFDEVYYARDTLKLSPSEVLPLVYPVSLLILKLFIAPIIYLAILFTSTLALARLLGGSSTRIARILVSGV